MGTKLGGLVRQDSHTVGLCVSWNPGGVRLRLGSEPWVDPRVHMCSLYAVIRNPPAIDGAVAETPNDVSMLCDKIVRMQECDPRGTTSGRVGKWLYWAVESCNAISRAFGALWRSVGGRAWAKTKTERRFGRLLCAFLVPRPSER